MLMVRNSSGSSALSALIAFLSPEVTAKRLTESMIPMAADITNIDVPPLLMKGSGCPDTGKSPVTIAICTNA